MAVDSNVVNQPEFKQRAAQAEQYLAEQFRKAETGKLASRKLNGNHAKL